MRLGRECQRRRGAPSPHFSVRRWIRADRHGGVGDVGDPESDGVQPFFGGAQGIFESFDAVSDVLHLLHKGVGRLLVSFERGDPVRRGLALVSQLFHLGEKDSAFMVQLEQPLPVSILTTQPKTGADFFSLLSDEAEIEHKHGHSTSASRMSQ
jgi:hypothetical protein